MRREELYLIPHLRRGAGQSGAAQQQISQVLGNLPGVSSAQVNQAVQAYTGLDAATTGSILSIIQGGPVNATTLGPVVATGMALLGASPPAIAAVAIGLSVLGAFNELFSPGAQQCSWWVHSLCFNKTRPSGPSDPAWVTFDSWIQATPQWFINQAYPWYYVMQCDLGAIPAQNAPPQLQFLQAYYGAWKANAEYAINGYNSIDECQLLGIVADAWNRGRDGSVTYTFLPTPAAGLGPAGTISMPSCPGDENLPPFVPGAPPTARSYVGLLMDGDITGTRCSGQGLPINIGSVTPAGNSAIQTAASLSGKPLSTGAKVAIGTGAVVGAGVVGIGLVALTKGWAFGKAAEWVWSRTGGKVVSAVKREARKLHR